MNLLQDAMVGLVPAIHEHGGSILAAAPPSPSDAIRCSWILATRARMTFGGRVEAVL